jgi:hypothetical protein
MLILMCLLGLDHSGGTDPRVDAIAGRRLAAGDHRAGWICRVGRAASTIGVSNRTDRDG